MSESIHVKMPLHVTAKLSIIDNPATGSQNLSRLNTRLC